MSATDEIAVRAEDRLAASRVRPTVARRRNEDVESLMQFYADGPHGQGLRGRDHARCVQALLASPHFLFRLEETAGRRPAGPELPRDRCRPRRRGCRTSSGARSRTPNCRRWRANSTLHTAGGAREAGPADALPIRSGEAMSTRFASQWLRLQDVEKIHPDALLFPSFDNEPGRNPTSAKPSCSSTASCARIATSSTCSRPTTRSSTSASPRSTGIPNITGGDVPAASSLDRREPARHPRPRQHPDADVGRRSDVAGAARQMDHGNAARVAAAAARRRSRAAAARGHARPATRYRQDAVGARAHGGAPQEPGVRVVPPR